MAHRPTAVWAGALCICAALLASPAVSLAAPESQRLGRAKDLIADEQWAPAIPELRAAAGDPKEPNRDEALFWLAHCESQARDAAAAVATIQRLEREYPRSRWVKPARSLRIEIAQRLRRNDVLWYTAVPPPPPPPPPAPPAVGAGPILPSRPTPPVPPPPSAAPPAWIAEGFRPDTDLRLQALGSLMHTDALKVIPMLRDIALSGHDPGDARRALFLLAQSSQAEARATVLEVARTGPDPVRLAAVRELGRLDGPAVATELLQVYATASDRVKHQVVTSLGQREASPALMRIAQSERDRALRNAAIAALGQAGAREQLAALYVRSRAGARDMKRPIIRGLFSARADTELIRIAARERDPEVREEIRAKLRLLGTPSAKAYLETLR